MPAKPADAAAAIDHIAQASDDALHADDAAYMGILPALRAMILTPLNVFLEPTKLLRPFSSELACLLEMSQTLMCKSMTK